MIDLSKIQIEDDCENQQKIRGGIGGKLLLKTSDIKENIINEITEIQNKLKYAGEYLPYNELFKLNCQLEVLERVLR